MSLPVILRTDAELNMGGSWPESITRIIRIVTAEEDTEEAIIRLAPEAEIISDLLTSGKMR